MFCKIHHYFWVLIDHKAIDNLWKGKKEPTTSLLLKLWDYIFDLKYQKGWKMSIIDTFSKLHIEEQVDIHNVMPMDFLQHLNTAHIYHDYRCVAYALYKQRVKQQIQTTRKPKRGKWLNITSQKQMKVTKNA